MSTPSVLIIRDGWGHNPHPEHDAFNAVKIARTPVADRLMAEWPWTLLKTSGEDVGLPEGTMGNSEVGHQNIGAGRVVDQESVRITKSIRSGDFYRNPVITDAIAQARIHGGAVHLMCIASDAGVHGLLTHLYACVEACKRQSAQDVFVHLFTDGRDTGPTTGKGFVAAIEAELKKIGVGRIATICGRYFAMDRDHRWERVERAYGLLTGRDDDAPGFATAAEAMDDAYANPIGPTQHGDEFVTPRFVGEREVIGVGDSVIFVNYRGDRPRELVRAFVMPEFEGRVKPSPDSGRSGFDRGARIELSAFVCMTDYEAELNKWVSVAFPRPPKMADIAGQAISALGLTQFRCAETEKYPHVTFFFNDYRDEPFEGERRVIVQSPKVATYDLAPEMSAAGVRDAVLERLRADDCEPFVVVNFANADMVGHTGNLDAAVTACEVVDACVGEIVEAVLQRGGSAIVTADHGNAEMMRDPATGSPHTAHTVFDVPVIVVGEGVRGAKLVERADADHAGDARLADLVPTMFQLMGLEQPDAMTGRSLIR
ncbi:MAG: 2,3-bisphosphoglycerate-independent phosphoglycerate mutase [Phycisphaerales bacterium]